MSVQIGSILLVEEFYHLVLNPSDPAPLSFGFPFEGHHLVPDAFGNVLLDLLSPVADYNLHMNIRLDIALSS